MAKNVPQEVYRDSFGNFYDKLEDAELASVKREIHTVYRKVRRVRFSTTKPAIKEITVK